jgi:subtilisin family serine protease
MIPPTRARLARWLVTIACLFVGLLVISLSPGVVASSQSGPPSASAEKITPALRTQFGSNPNAKLRYLVLLAEQADPTNSIRDWNAKGWFVYNTLKGVADRTQPPVRALLETQKRAGNVDSYKGYYIVNSFQVTGNLASAQALTSLPEVGKIDEWPQVTFDEGTPIPVSSAPNAVEWNVAMVRAPQAWAMGYTGQGYTVGSLDTGARYTHSSFVAKYRGNLGGGNFDHNYNWWDPIRGTPVPYDADGHGTHTIGTILGDDGLGNQVGVAPGAQWIATNGIGSGWSYNSMVEAGEFMLAPTDLTGQNPDPSRRPIAVSNSWRAPNSGYGFNCSTYTFYRDIVQAWVAAGIFPSFAAGNGGNSGNTCPACFPEAFDIGSITSGGVLSSFSSIGPSCFDQGQLPQIVTGGSNVRSSTAGSDTSYGLNSGTSMAQPAVAGAIAILKQANPNLTVEETWYILTTTAVMSPTWGSRPNTRYGWGLMQVDAAVKLALQMGGTPQPTRTPTTPPTNTPTATPTLSATPAITNTPTPTVDPCGAGIIYFYSTATATIVPGTVDTGNHCDDCLTAITLPFSFPFYRQSYTSAYVSSNGMLRFGTGTSAFPYVCLPSTIPDPTMFVHDDDLRTDGVTCTGGCGIFTSVTGSAPNRVFNIEWRATYFSGPGDANFEIRLYENSGYRLDYIYGSLGQGGVGANVGVQNGSSGQFTQYSCNNAIPYGRSVIWTVAICEPTMTPTNTSTRIRTNTPVTLTATHTATATPTCGPFWRMVPIPSPVATWKYTYGVAQVAPNDVWAVGDFTGELTPFIEHWDGSQWTLASFPAVERGELKAVDALSANDVWAVGFYANSANTDRNPLVYHWNGSIWSIVPVPEPVGSVAELTGVAAISANDIWAVGHYYIPNGRRTLTLHWNGSEWSIVPSPSPNDHTYLLAVAAAASSDVWAVGYTNVGADSLNAILHWNGSAWSVVPAPNPGSQNGLHAVTALSATDAWAVGYSRIGFDTPVLTMRWNGTQWNVIPGPVGDRGSTHINGTLHGVKALSANNVWAVGINSSGLDADAVIIHWDGAQWNRIAASYPGTGRRLYAIDALSPNELWAVGWWRNSGSDAFSLAMRYTGPPCPTNTPTHTRTPIHTATPCPMTFTDVQPGDFFYEGVRYLYCAGAISGYADNTFRPYNNMTRGQLTKVIVLAYGLLIYTPPTPVFTDVPATHPFFTYVHTAHHFGIISGYADGTFRPYNNITRGQVAKVVVLAAEWPIWFPGGTPTFLDVTYEHPFFTHIETAYCHGVMQGYSDGTFRPYNNATRGQISKVVHEALLNTASCR